MINEPMKLLAEFDNEAEVETAVALLREAGIEVLTSRDQASASVFGQTPYELTGLAVPVSREAEARTVLAQLGAPPEPGWEQMAEHAVDGWVCSGCDTVVPQGEAVCPECGTSRSAQPAPDTDE